MNAIGLIEVIGYVAAIEACDACVKSANVNLVSVDKVGSGIVTLTITGDVGSVKSAVESGEIAVKKIGTLRSTHVIPRVHKEVADILLKKDSKEKIEVEVKETLIEEISTMMSEEIKVDEASSIKVNEETLDGLEIEVESSMKIEDEKIKNIEALNKVDEINEENTNNDKEDLSKFSVKQLKVLAKELDGSLTNKSLNALKKEELLDLVAKLSRGDR